LKTRQFPPAFRHVIKIAWALHIEVKLKQLKGAIIMALLFTREFVCERLKISLRQSRCIFPSDIGGRIFDETVVQVLRNKAMYIPNMPTGIPSDLLRPEELAEELGADRPWVMRLITHKTKKVPHYRLNEHITLIPRAIFMAWASKQTKRIRTRRFLGRVSKPVTEEEA